MLFSIITFVWWILLLVSIFVSPPGLHSRGSGFTDFAFTTLTVGLLVVALLFFTGPSLAMRVSLGIVAFLLVVDTIIIVAVPQLRMEEGWVGIASVVWAAVVAIWCLITDRVVEWGKKEEEERLTGRPETRRTAKEWLAVLMGTIILAVFIVIVVLMTATLSLRAIDAGLPYEGERYFVDAGKYQVHLACVGNATAGEPTILLEAGEVPSEYDFEHWAYNAVDNGTISRYCYWDRPGYAWSDNAPSPHSAGMSSEALTSALVEANEEGPWIAVGAGYGAVVSRIFAAHHPRDVVGIMLIDPLHEDLLHRLGTPARGFTDWGYGILSPLGVQRLAGALFKSRSREDRVYGRSVSQTGKYLKARLQENLVADSLTHGELVSARNIQSGAGADVPVVIVSSGKACRLDAEWERKQQDLTHITDKLVSWDVVGRAPHEVWRTLDGREVMEKRLGELVRESRRVLADRTEL